MKRVFHHPAREEAPRLWRSLREMENDPEFEDILRREFPRGADVYEDGGLSRRDFVRLLGASVALAGLAGCRRPEAYQVPFSMGAEWSIPGKFLRYATAMPARRGAAPLIVTTVDGRPIKVEGNPLHPACNGGTDVFAQASVLDLYDPHRSRVFRENGQESSAENFDAMVAQIARGRLTRPAILTEVRSSPTRGRLRTELERKYPGLLWCEYDPLGGGEAVVADAVFGAGIRTVPRFERADVILALDSDFLNCAEYGSGFAAGFYPRRNPDQQTAPMNRLYVAESHYTLTGGMADHRHRCKASLIGEFACRIAGRVATQTGNSSLAALLGTFPRSTAEFDENWITACADDLAANSGRGIVITGPQSPAAVQVLVHAINDALGNNGLTISGVRCDTPAALGFDDLRRAVSDGSVDALFILGGNPAYDAPADVDFPGLLRHIPQTVRLGLFEDETSRLCRWHVPAAHYLETWGDARASDGTVSSIQPMILPLWNGVAELDVLARLAGRPKPDGPELIKETLALSTGRSGGDLDQAWNDFVRAGFLPDSAWVQADLAFNQSATEAIAEGAVPGADGLELVFIQSSSVDDGRYANNSWLQETPDFVTKLTWDNAALLSPATAAKLGVKSGEDNADIIEIRVRDRSIRAAAIVAPGQADDSIAIALGYGREGVSALLENVGFNAYPLRNSDAMRFRTGVTVSLTGERYPLARTQEHRSMEGHALFRGGTLERYHTTPDFAQAMDMPGDSAANPTMFPHPPLTAPEQWGMTVDLNTCTGCNACVVACRAENNVPVVGKDQVRRGRDMAWIRIDRYFTGDAANPELLPQAVMCQQCENAPCETVCPVDATVHSEDGLNLMAYNRCIGTRYCASNCPWKVRRFNFFDYNQRPLDQLYAGPLAPKGMAESIKMVKNPNVTVRMRGVMEKCTFCIQRIEEAKISRLVQAGPSDKARVPMPEIQTACQQSCPSKSIVFGNIADPASRVSRLRGSHRGYAMLKYLNTNPRVTYLARIKNPNPAIKS